MAWHAPSLLIKVVRSLDYRDKGSVRRLLARLLG